jgi:hypothetical protein
VPAGDAGGPPLDFGALDFNRSSTVPADEVVMVVIPGAATVSGFAIVASESIELASFGEDAELVVDGGQGDVLALGLQLGVQVLGGTESVGGVQDGSECTLLSGRAFLWCSTR